MYNAVPRKSVCFIQTNPHQNNRKYEADMYIRSIGSYQSEISKLTLNYINETAYLHVIEKWLHTFKYG